MAGPATARLDLIDVEVDVVAEETVEPQLPLSLKSRARALAEYHQEVADTLSCAAAGYPDRLLKASWKGRLDTDVACLVRDIEKELAR